MAEQPRPVPGDVQDGYRYMGGDPGQEKNWMQVQQPQLPAPPPESLGTKAASLTYRAGKALPSFAAAVAPSAAAIGAGIADPLAAPITAPLAYGATEGLISPKTIQQHPVREGLTAASMAIPGPAEAVGYAFPKFAVEHPGLIRGVGAGVGAVGGGMLGERTGAGRYGELGGAGFGALAGYRLAGSEVGALGEKLIQDTLRGARPMNELPERLVPAYMREARAIARAQAEMALERGEDPAMLKIPSGGKSQVEKTIEERARSHVPDPSLIALPGQDAERAQAARAMEVATQELKAAGRYKGMARVAGEHELEYVPKGRATKLTESKSYRLQPRRALPIVPPE